MLALKKLIDTANDKRSSRITLSVLLFLIPGGVLFGFGILWGLWDWLTAIDSQVWALPMGLGVLLALLSFLAPLMPIWLLNVPDNEVWMLMDGADHLLKFVGSGVHRVQPVQGYAPYPQKGMIPVTVELEQVLTNDHFPYRVTVNVNAMFNPLNAAPESVKMLRSITKDGLAAGLRADITHIVKQHLLGVGRAEIDPSVLVNTIGEAIREAIETRKGLGVGLMPGNSVKINMEPPPEVLAARNELWAEESKAKLRITHMTEILKLAGATDMSVGELGKLHFFLNPQPGMRINFQGNHDPFAAPTPPSAAAPRDKSQSPPVQLPPQPNYPQLPAQSVTAYPPADAPIYQPPVQMPKLEAPMPSNPNPGQTNNAGSSGGGGYGRTPEPPANLPENLPKQPPRPPEAPETPPRKSDSGVIETIQDENGTYVPVNPILRRKKKKGN